MANISNQKAIFLNQINLFIIFTTFSFTCQSYLDFSEDTSSFQWMSRVLDGTKFHSINDLGTFHDKTSISSTTKPTISSILWHYTV